MTPRCTFSRCCWLMASTSASSSGLISTFDQRRCGRVVTLISLAIWSCGMFAAFKILYRAMRCSSSLSILRPRVIHSGIPGKDLSTSMFQEQIRPCSKNKCESSKNKLFLEQVPRTSMFQEQMPEATGRSRGRQERRTDTQAVIGEERKHRGRETRRGCILYSPVLQIA